jgi:predicted ATP-grasp superfamily ATP-dependent carboligase
VPLTIYDLQYLNESRHLVLHNPIPIPSADSIALCDNKPLFNQTLIEKGFGEFIPNVCGTQKYPYILKKQSDEWGVNSHIISDAQQEHAFADILAQPDYFCQEFIQGSEEYATHVLFIDQKILYSMNIKYHFNNKFPIKGKDPFSYTKICHCPYLDLFSSILTSIGYEGLCCINYKVSNNRPFILEINPRFGGSLSTFFFSCIRHLD